MPHEEWAEWEPVGPAGAQAAAAPPGEFDEFEEFSDFEVIQPQALAAYGGQPLSARLRPPTAAERPQSFLGRAFREAPGVIQDIGAPLADLPSAATLAEKVVGDIPPAGEALIRASTQVIYPEEVIETATSPLGLATLPLAGAGKGVQVALAAALGAPGAFQCWEAYQAGQSLETVPGCGQALASAIGAGAAGVFGGRGKPAPKVPPPSSEELTAMVSQSVRNKMLAREAAAAAPEAQVARAVKGVRREERPPVPPPRVRGQPEPRPVQSREVLAREFEDFEVTEPRVEEQTIYEGPTERAPEPAAAGEPFGPSEPFFPPAGEEVVVPPTAPRELPPGRPIPVLEEGEIPIRGIPPAERRPQPTLGSEGRPAPIEAPPPAERPPAPRRGAFLAEGEVPGLGREGRELPARIRKGEEAPAELFEPPTEARFAREVGEPVDVTQEAVEEAFPAGRVSKSERGRYLVALPGNRKVWVEVRSGGLGVSEATLRASHPEGEGLPAAGAWYSVGQDGIIALARGTPRRVLYHEVGHDALNMALGPARRLKLLKDRVVQREARARAGDAWESMPEDQQLRVAEEAAMDMYADEVLSGRTKRLSSPAIRMLYEVRDFFRNIWRKLSGRAGWTEFVEETRTGRIYETAARERAAGVGGTFEGPPEGYEPGGGEARFAVSRERRPVSQAEREAQQAIGGPGGFRRATEQTVDVLGKIPGVGPELRQRVIAFREDLEVPAGQAVAQIERALGEEGVQWPEVRRLLESRAPIPRGTSSGRAAVAIRSTLDQVYRDAQAVVSDTPQFKLEPFRKAYFPRLLKQAPSFQDLVEFRAAQIQRDLAAKKGFITEADARVRANQELHQARKYSKTKADYNIERERKLPERGPQFRDDPEVLTQYILDAYRRISQAKHFGPSGQKINPLIGAIGRDDLRQYAEKALAQIQDQAGYGKDAVARMLARVRGFEAHTKLATGPLNQLGGVAQVLGEAGLANTTRGIVRTLRSPREARLLATQSGALHASLTGETGKAFGGSARFGFPAAVGWTDKWLRVVASSTSREMVPRLLEAAKGGSKAALRELEGLGVLEMAQKTQFQPTQTIFDKAGKRFVELTQFRTDPAHMPRWMTTPWGRTSTQFLSFMYQHGRFMKRITQEAAQGRPQKLVRFLTGAAIVGEGIADAKALFKGYDLNIRGDKDEPEEFDWNRFFSNRRVQLDLSRPESIAARYFQNLATVGGVGMIQAVVERAFFARNPLEVIPAGGDAARIFKGGQAAVQGEFKEAGRQLAPVVIPAVGFEVAKEFLPREGELPPPEPGHVGRLREKFVPGLKEEREAARAVKGAAARKARAAEEARRQGIELKPQHRTAAERATGAERAATRAEYQNEIMEMIRDGNMPGARRRAREIARRTRGKIEFQVDKMRKRWLAGQEPEEEE